MVYKKGDPGNKKGSPRAGKPQPNAQLIAARLASKGPEEDQPGDDEQVKRFRAIRRKDPFQFERFLAQLERDLRGGKKSAKASEEPDQGEKPADDPGEKDEGVERCLALYDEWLKGRTVEADRK